MIYDEGSLDFEPDALARLAFTGTLVLAVHRALGGSEHNPCCLFYCADGLRGFEEPLALCGCRWPVWELRRSA